MTDGRCQETFTQKIISKLYLSDSFSDVSLKFGDESLPAHKLLLAASCPKFSELLTNDDENKQNETVRELDVSHISKQLFMVVLKYIYWGLIDLKSMSDDDIMKLYSLTEELQFHELIQIVGKALNEITVTVENVGKIYEVADRFKLLALNKKCIDFVDKNTTRILKKLEIFTKYPLCFIKAISELESFSRKQLELFEANVKWREINPESNSTAVFQNMRLDFVEPDKFDEVIRPTGLISDNQYFNAHRQKKINSSKIRKTVIVVFFSYILMCLFSLIQRLLS
ncbi:BTB/POZ domain-containing protein 9-like protein [Leptotrombidium deliense]|uniref:BTB/POZ domain-containing protein 9-like protein n=1 Tax=Leptotrombidium deliense TaxID=299467 RepID=A0A443SIH7_9ACAR|nr:BTB/POZ domain-containing protein 9-like protein [Leptotrombidium deliense]